MGKYLKILSIFLIVLILIVSISETCYAADLGLGDLDKYKDNNTGSDKLNGYAGKILGVLQTVGVVISVVMLMVIGIKYMLGSVEEKAEYKNTLVPYLIGAFLVFAATTVPNLIYKFAQNL